MVHIFGWYFLFDCILDDRYRGFQFETGDIPIAGWYIIEHSIKMDDLEVPPFHPFQKTPYGGFLKS